MNVIVPPGGFAGFAQMTSASRAALGAGTRGSSGGSRRRKRKTSAKKPAKRRAKRSGGGRKIKFGSPAWRKKYKLGKSKK